MIKWWKELVAHAKRNEMSVVSIVRGRTVFWFQHGYGYYIWCHKLGFDKRKVFWKTSSKAVDIRPIIDGKKKPFIVDIFEASRTRNIWKD